MKKSCLFILISIILSACEYDQEYYDVSVSVDKTKYYLSTSSGNSTTNSSDLISATITGGAPKALFYPVLIKYQVNGDMLSYMDFSEDMLMIYENCCLEGLFENGSDYNGDRQGIICNCEVDGNINHEIQREWTGTTFIPLAFYNTSSEYRFALIDPYIKADGSRGNIAKRIPPNNKNIVTESEVFSFINDGGGGLVTSYNCTNGNCVDPGDGNGQYSTLSACQTACGVSVSYNCVNGNCIDPGDGNGQYSTLSACQVSCGVSLSYNCINGNCIDPGNGNGQYSSLSACLNACNVNSSWDCDGNGNCFDPGTGNGQFSTLSNCQMVCTAPPSWDCDGNGNCYDPGTGNGFYSSLSSCNNACSGPSWDCDGNGNCYDPGDGSGQYSTLSSCQSNCLPPPPPNDPCNITSVTYGPYTILLSPSQNTALAPNVYNFGDQVTITMYHPSYQFNQGGVELYKNETFITSLVGSFGTWSSSQRTISLPSSGAGASNCYTIRVTGAAGNPPYFTVSDPITIY